MKLGLSLILSEFGNRELRNADQILVGKPEEKSPLGKSTHSWDLKKNSV
jgi:hypothetical protein